MDDSCLNQLLLRPLPNDNILISIISFHLLAGILLKEQFSLRLIYLFVCLFIPTYAHEFLFSGLTSVTMIICYDGYISVPYLGSRSRLLCSFVLLFLCSHHFLNTSFISGMTRCSRLILYFPSPNSEISHFSKDPGSVWRIMVFTNQDLDIGWGAAFFKCVISHSDKFKKQLPLDVIHDFKNNSLQFVLCLYSF